MFNKVLNSISDITVTGLVALLGIIGVAMDSEKTREWLYYYYLEDNSSSQFKSN